MNSKIFKFRIKFCFDIIYHPLIFRMLKALENCEKVLAVSLSSLLEDPSPLTLDEIREAQDALIKKRVFDIGQWEYSLGSNFILIRFQASGRFQFSDPSSKRADLYSSQVQIRQSQGGNRRNRAADFARLRIGFTSRRTENESALWGKQHFPKFISLNQLYFF